MYMGKGMMGEIDEQEFLKYNKKRVSPSVVAKALNVEYSDLFLWMTDHNYKLNFSRTSLAFERRAVTLWCAGYSDEELAHAMGVKKHAMTGWRVRRGLKANKTDKIAEQDIISLEKT